MRAWFYDTWGFLALANAGDADHGIAADADRWRMDQAILVVTSEYILDETLTALHAAAGAKVAVRFLDLLESRIAAGTVMLLEITSERRDRALQAFRRLAPDVPRLSLTDCSSFVVMEELGLTTAFTADRHFHRPGAGIRPLFLLRRGKLVWSPLDLGRR
jgi:predicted nucleic acid-binding protein